MELAAGRWLQRLRVDWKEKDVKSPQVLAEVVPQLPAFDSKALFSALETTAAALERERRLRVSVERQLLSSREKQFKGERTLATEVSLRRDVMAQLRTEQKKVAELQRVLADDESLRVIDDFRSKLDSQRNSTEALRQQLQLAHEREALAQEALRRGQAEWAACRQMLQQVSLERDQAAHDLAQLRHAGEKLQAAADGALTACSEVAAQAQAEALERNRAVHDLAELRHAGEKLQATADGVVACSEAAQALVEGCAAATATATATESTEHGASWSLGRG